MKNIQVIRKTFIIGDFLVFEIFKIVHLFLSPVLVIFAAFQGIVNGSLLIFIILFLSSLFFGRAFCAWICPGGGLNEVCGIFTTKKVTGRYNHIKYFISGIWISIIFIAFLFAGRIVAIDPFYGIFFSSSLQEFIMFFGVLLLIVPFALLFGPRTNCHYFCWIAPILIIGTKIGQKLTIPSFHLVADSTTCLQCKKCDSTCPMSLKVSQLVKTDSITDNECILCGSCVNICPAQAIKLKFGKKTI